MEQFDEVIQTILSEWKVLYPSIKDCVIYPVGFTSPSEIHVCVGWEEPQVSRVPREFRDLANVIRNHSWKVDPYPGDQYTGRVSRWNPKEKRYWCELVFTYIITPSEEASQ